MPILTKNQRIEVLMMLARRERVIHVSRTVGCRRNTIIPLRERFQQTSGVTDRHKFGRPRVKNERTGLFITLTHHDTCCTSSYLRYK